MMCAFCDRRYRHKHKSISKDTVPSRPKPRRKKTDLSEGEKVRMK